MPPEWHKNVAAVDTPRFPRVIAKCGLSRKKKRFHLQGDFLFDRRISLSLSLLFRRPLSLRSSVRRFRLLA